MNESKDKSRNISLIIGLSIPIAMVVFIAIAINWPKWFNTEPPPQHDFLYRTGQQHQYQHFYVEDGSLKEATTENTSGLPLGDQYLPHFMVHDVSENKSREISMDEAMSLRLIGSIQAPDGYSLQAGRRGGWFIFGYYGDQRNRYLVKDRISYKQELVSDGSRSNYYRNVKFLAWIVDEQ